MKTNYKPTIRPEHLPEEDRMYDCWQNPTKPNYELRCGVRVGIEGESWVCTKQKGHDGDHVAHYSTGEACARWTNENPPKPKTAWDSDYEQK